MKQPLNTLKSWVVRRWKPMVAQVQDWMDSYWHKDETIPMANIEGLTTTLNNTATSAQITTLDNAKVNRSGDTMTGTLTLPGAPAADLHAATKKYVDDGLTNKVSKSGDTMTGALTIPDATADGHAANKRTVASLISALVNSAPETLNTLHELATALNNDPSFATTITNALAAKVAKSGDTMTGTLTLAGAPTADLHAATKKYVDDNGSSSDSGWVYAEPVNDSSVQYSFMSRKIGKIIFFAGMFTLKDSTSISIYNLLPANFYPSEIHRTLAVDGDYWGYSPLNLGLIHLHVDGHISFIGEAGITYVFTSNYIS